MNHFGLDGRVAIQVGTLSQGGRRARAATWRARRPCATSSSSGPGRSCSPRAIRPRVAAACREAIRIMQEEPELHERLWANTRRFKAELGRLGFDIGHSETPITPVILGDSETTIRFSNRLFDEGVFATSVVFPTVALDRARIRTIVTAAHTDEHARPGAGGVRPRGPRAGRDRAGERARPRARPIAADTRARADVEHEVCKAGVAAGLGDVARPAAGRAPPHGPLARRERACSRRTARWPSSAGSASSRSPTTSTSTRRCPPTGSPRSRTGSATCARRRRAGRTAGLAIRFGVEVTYERRVRGRDPRLAAAPPARLRHRQRAHQRRLAVQGGARRRRSSPGRSLAGDRRALLRRGRSGRRGPGCSTRIGHLDFVKRYLVPHVLPAELAAAPGAVRAGPRRARRDGDGAGGQRLGAAPAAARDLPGGADRRAATGSWAARHVTIGIGCAPNGVVRIRARGGVSSRDRRRVRGARVPTRGPSGWRCRCRYAIRRSAGPNTGDD